MSPAPRRVAAWIRPSLRLLLVLLLCGGCTTMALRRSRSLHLMGCTQFDWVAGSTQTVQDVLKTGEQVFRDCLEALPLHPGRGDPMPQKHRQRDKDRQD